MNNINKQELYRIYFNEIDPIGIFFDENVDEYDPEIKEFLSSGIDFKNPEIVKEKLSNIFKKYFEGIEIDESKIKKLTLLILKNSNK